MIVLKGDIVRTKSGAVGEVKEISGVAREFIKLTINGVKSPPMFASEVTEIIERPNAERHKQKKWASSPRERG
ncbi:hypothetical protein [Paenibacillus antibioticophila]|uniref:hypothetical protein n=1 Tax=Paenibacillus antibioticophila TaxID=1274374 RepID=UPI0005C90CCE|nr:hypothetical protein [Paenibacillus antibioticophila]